MSIETLIQNLIDAVNRNTEALNKPFVAPISGSIPLSGGIMPCDSVSGNPNAAPIVVDHIPAPAPTMPPPPTFSAPPAMIQPSTPSPTNAPFTDIAGLIKYATDKYYALGANANKIGDIITSMGCQNINDIRPEQFGTFYSQVELIQKG